MNILEFAAGRSRSSESLDRDPGESAAGELAVELGLGELFVILSRVRLVPACTNDLILSGSSRKRSSKRVRRIFSSAEAIMISQSAKSGEMEVYKRKANRTARRQHGKKAKAERRTFSKTRVFIVPGLVIINLEFDCDDTLALQHKLVYGTKVSLIMFSLIRTKIVQR